MAAARRQATLSLCAQRWQRPQSSDKRRRGGRRVRSAYSANLRWLVGHDGVRRRVVGCPGKRGEVPKRDYLQPTRAMFVPNEAKDTGGRLHDGLETPIITGPEIHRVRQQRRRPAGLDHFGDRERRQWRGRPILQERRKRVDDDAARSMIANELAKVVEHAVS